MSKETEFDTLDGLIKDTEIIVCVGNGGVGKTTISAVIGLHAALMGKKTLVLTIDPAKRLANSLGLEGIDHRETQIPLQQVLELAQPPKGELWAMMLDMKEAFDRVVRRNTDSPEAADRILNNKFYKYFSSSLAGTQDYSAVEQLHEIWAHKRYDLIVLDTPPSQHAMDFLEAPDRLYQALDNSALQWLYRPALASGRIGMGLFNFGARYIRKTIGRFTGGTLLEDLSVLIQSLGPMWSGFSERAHKVQAILHSRSTLFLVVATPDAHTLEDAQAFDTRLRAHGVNFGGFVINRVHTPVLDPSDPEDRKVNTETLADALLEIPGAEFVGRAMITPIARAMVQNADDFSQLAEKDRQMLSELKRTRGTGKRSVGVFPIPLYSRDIYSLAGLDRVRKALFEE